MQRTTLPAGRSMALRQRASASLSRRAQKPFTSSRITCAAASSSNGNGNGSHQANVAAAPRYPSPAQTIRTLVDIVNEGTLCSVSATGHPIGIPVTFSTDKTGAVSVQLDRATADMANLQAASSCSLLVQANTHPTRAVAAVTLVGKVDASAEGAAPLHIDHCIYFGGLDQAHRGQTVSAADYAAAEPDVLRKAAPELVATWNDERAEDIYRIVSDHLGVPLTEMSYAELLWVDYLGMYIRSEVAGKEAEVVRVPFYRPVLDERDARSVITMAAQIGWERERSYTPPSVLPGIYAETASNN